MSLFADMESREPAKRGLLGRLKAFKAGFTDSSSGAVPIVGREPVDGGEPTVAVDGPREPRFKTASKPVNPRQTNQGHPMTMGMMLRRAQEEIEDVAEFDEAIGSHRVADKDVSPSCGSPKMEASGLRIPAESDTATSTVDVRADTVPSSEPEASMWAERAADPEHGSTRVTEPTEPPAADAVQESESALHRPADYDESPTVRRIGMDVTEAPDVSIETGRPRLVHADSLTFKRVLCQREESAALAVTELARREFIAVELQAGISIVVSTQRFHESQLYATYLKDLARADISVHEEMVADEDVIAALYSKEKQRASTTVPESSRAIGAFRDVIEAAKAYGAGDVHWEYREFADDVELRLRVDGDLYSYRKMPKALVRRALSAAYQDLVQRNTNSGETFQPTAPQSAMIPLVAHMDLLNIRWQSTPLVGGFDVALRLLDGNFKHVKVLLPHEMGLEASQLEILDSLGKVTGGATFLTGETGSAKTTLLRAMSYLVPNRDRIKQFAVNEPSEVPAPWLSDISIQRRPGETEEDANRKIVEVIRTLMRMDPDDLTIGEVRDSVLAGLVAELALTGHPVRTTLHGNSILGAVMRLVGGRLKLPMDEVASGSFLNAVGNQKLIPILCPHCKRPAREVLSPGQIATLERKFGLDTSTMACRDEDGCEHCRRPGLFTRSGKVAAGIKGQTLAMELYRPTPEFLERVSARDWRGAEHLWRTSRKSDFADADMTGKTVYEHALYKASRGLIDPRFIDESMCAFDAYRVAPDSDGVIPS
ncbi:MULTISPECIES: ATPase, T2SS/T4P/T4SS family [Burkholderia]|uniref:ATPase, T2SS/T4P/T4SS family n=1 Tax=Burkholderia TaxID=32008 RepID=UPI000752D618|nr:MULTISPECIES: ATPase, T2SS/T4P/T4SS family [Burkholderia]AOJ73338.1 secretion system protein E [Burkholderia savannae]KVG43040.1 secretion system protein E [Burkholderia sp. MSMB0265]KVG87539.1 secretion system protein E [Burkholderia sp. MSMB2040]KVG92058.1 secretion system protein E [Burkholderia sp. MSMB2042]KVH01129.1 secretion system protein E [Burkholderia sp. MSMB2041]